MGAVNFDQCPRCRAFVVADQWCTYCGAELPDPRLGVVLDGRYRVDRLIGQGGYGRVYRGTHMALSSPVAIKFLLAQWSARPKERTRFRREAQALVKLRHPGIVTALDLGEHQGELYLVMEYVQGTPLADLVLRHGRTLPLDRIVRILDKVLEVLEATHVQAIVHRDLKPENILLFNVGTETEYVKLLDFGLALATDEPQHERLTAPNSVLGTPLYMSPEQASARDVGPPSDIYSLGVMLYEMLTGAQPFSGDNAATIMAQHLYVDPPPTGERGLRHPAPPEFESLARRMLAKQPGDRPTATQLREELRAALAGTGTVSRSQQAHQERVATAGLSRDERALPRPADVASPVFVHEAVTVERPVRQTDAYFPPPQVPQSVLNEAARPLVVLWNVATTRLTDLETGLGLSRIQAARWHQSTPPPTTLGDRTVRAVVIGEKRALGIEQLRGQPETARVPIIAIDVRDATEMPALIRAGASDAMLETAGTDQICRKVIRLIHRGR